MRERETAHPMSWDLRFLCSCRSEGGRTVFGARFSFSASCQRIERSLGMPSMKLGRAKREFSAMEDFALLVQESKLKLDSLFPLVRMEISLHFGIVRTRHRRIHPQTFPPPYPPPMSVITCQPSDDLHPEMSLAHLGVSRVLLSYTHRRKTRSGDMSNSA